MMKQAVSDSAVVGEKTLLLSRLRALLKNNEEKYYMIGRKGTQLEICVVRYSSCFYLSIIRGINLSFKLNNSPAAAVMAASVFPQGCNSSGASGSLL